MVGSARNLIKKAVGVVYFWLRLFIVSKGPNAIESDSDLVIHVCPKLVMC